MDLKKLCKTLLFPRVWVMITLIPVATVFLVCSMVFLGTASVPAVISYGLAAYTLTVWCVRIPRLIEFFQTFKKENKYARRYFDDERLRVNISLYGSLAGNAAFAVFQLWLGFYHRSFWFFSLSGYYILLAVMRYFLVRHTSHHKPREQMREELRKYRACGVTLLVMNLALTLMIFFMVYFGRTFLHYEITAIIMAAYTFTAFAFAIVNVVRYRKYQSPVYSATKAIGLAAATVSVLTLESTMLTTFGDGTIDAFGKRLLLGITGGAVSLFIVGMAVYMIVQGTKKLKALKAEEQGYGKQ